MRKTTRTVLAAVAALGCTGAATSTASAQIPAPRVACGDIFTVGQAYGITDPVAALQIRIEGTLPVSHEISNLKRLSIRGLNAFVDRGDCRIDAEYSVKLYRKIRRDATGVIRLHGTMAAYEANGYFDWNSGQWLRTFRLCFGEAVIDDVELSNTLNLGEAAYALTLADGPGVFCFDTTRSAF